MVTDKTGLPLLAGLVLLAGDLAPASAHPAHAKPVNYPFVVGFERFHSGVDDDDYLSGGGLILLNELNCVACHAPPDSLASRLTGTESSDLTGVATRLSPLDLEIMIRSPRFLKRDSTMPSLFAGPDRDLDEVKAIKHYLSTLTYNVPEYERGEVEAGRRLYHRIGCVACHAPEVGYRPEGIPENAGIEFAGLPSVPMNLADLYDLGTLTHFLLHPREHRPSGRMPDFELSLKEASDLAAYLKAGPDLVLPEVLTEALTQAIPFEFDPELGKKGRELFSAKNCTACHSIPGEEEPLTRARSRPLAELDPDSRTGCFSDRPVGGGVPSYGLDAVQKRALSASLKRLAGIVPPDRESEIDWRMKTLNCYACHERGGTGGPEVSREVYFGFGEGNAVSPGRWGHLPPALDQVGEKLTPEWLERVLYGVRGGGSVRPYMAAKMPLFREHDLALFTSLFPEPKSPEESPSGNQESAEEGEAKGDAKGELDAGETLFGAEGAGCIRCHDAGQTRSTEWPGIDLATSPKRLQRSYFEHLLLDPQSPHPGTPVPDFLDGDEAGPTLLSLWNWLRSLASP